MTHQGYLEIKIIFCRKLLYSGEKNQTFVLKFEYYPVSLFFGDCYSPKMNTTVQPTQIPYNFEPLRDKSRALKMFHS